MPTMATKTPPTPVDDLDQDPNQDTAVDVQDTDVEIVDGDDDEQDDHTADDANPKPEFGLAVVNKGVARRNQETGLSVSHRAVALATPSEQAQDTGSYQAQSGSLPPEPKLLNTMYGVTKASVKERILKAAYDQTFNYQDMGPVRKTCTMGGGLAVHPDLLRCLEKLVPYLAHVTEQVPASPYELEHGQALPLLWSNVVVNSVSITEKGVTLSGYKKLKGNRQLVLNSPFIEFNGERDSWYRHAEDVERLVEDLKSEVVLAIEGKAFNPQLGLFNDEQANEDDDEEEAA